MTGQEITAHLLTTRSNQATQVSWGTCSPKTRQTTFQGSWLKLCYSSILWNVQSKNQENQWQPIGKQYCAHTIIHPLYYTQKLAQRIDVLIGGSTSTPELNEILTSPYSPVTTRQAKYSTACLYGKATLTFPPHPPLQLHGFSWTWRKLLIQSLNAAINYCLPHYPPHEKGWGNWWGNVSTLQAVRAPT
jgi:hypothetical protein